jgi:dual specificity tyrosine-phosphorylation-regulated kinase 2/3/4
LYENLFESIIKKKAMLADSHLKKLSKDILTGLKFLKGRTHSDCGIVHCDLKPENIMYTSREKNEVKIIDFGSAGFVNEEPIDYLQTRPYRYRRD